MAQKAPWQNHPITIRPEDTNASAPSTSETTAIRYLKAYRWRKGPKPAGAPHLCLEAFLWAGNSSDRPTLLAILKAPAMKALEPWKCELLHSNVWCQRWEKSLEEIRQFEKIIPNP